MHQGFIKIHRSILDWEWYDDSNTKILLLHLILKANYQTKKWQGHLIKRGEYITSGKKLSEETGLTHQQTRTSLSKLKSTNEITIKSTNKFTLIKLVKYDDYQDCCIGNKKQITNEQQTNNKQITTTKEIKEIKEINYKEKIKKEKSTSKSKVVQIPTIKDIEEYCLERKNDIDPKLFFDYYSKTDENDETETWENIKNWKKKMITWECRARNSNKYSSKSSREQRTVKMLKEMTKDRLIDKITLKNANLAILFCTKSNHEILLNLPDEIKVKIKNLIKSNLKVKKIEFFTN